MLYFATPCRDSSSPRTNPPTPKEDQPKPAPEAAAQLGRPLHAQQQAHTTGYKPTWRDE
ncbi:hypothetical protein NC653_028455 [Populus alba x Populus x berolinensis]|uniref:Uncharacterized protein n=1 Tax=Populus alba x Populus x berolinensis TaxID=444605 RepID=A0AAD6Q6B0_9ROSI|nr:hypothetical protein NC653_028455 [Populus alba x Populus x berolinensis]